MTTPLFLTNAYARDALGHVIDITDEGGIVLDRSLFYATGGGQPGDSGRLDWCGNSIGIATTIKRPLRKEQPGVGQPGKERRSALVLIPSEPQMLPPIGALVTQRIDWERRYQHMRMHTALHLLSVVISLPVTGGAIGADRSRLDFAMPEPPDDPAALEAALNDLISQDLPVTDEWISEAELDANPALVKTMSVQPPRGAGRIRLVRIGQEGEGAVDLQPCGGTHVAQTGEIGPVRIARIENKGKQNRRVSLVLA